MQTFFTILTITIFSVLTSLAQAPFSPVNLQEPNITQLELLTFNSVNQLRKEKNHPDLIWDEVLLKAAKDHAEYLIKENKISHYQTIKGKRTPAERVKIHGGLIYSIVGENIVEIPLGVNLPVAGIKRSTVTYLSSSQTMALAWKASPGHYKNIINPKYNCTALGIAYDPGKQRLIAVQVFGYVTNPGTQTKLPDYSSELLNYPEQKLPFRLNKYKYQSKNTKAINRFQNLKVHRGYLIGSYKIAKRIFKGRRSGISQEYIPLSQFDSTSKEFSSIPNRRNGLYELNGQLSKPVYRRKLLKYSRKNTQRPIIISTPFFQIKGHTKQFIYPLASNGYKKEFNLFFIKSKRLVSFKTYLNVSAKLFDDNFPSLNYTNSFKELKTEKKFRICYTYDTLQYKIYFTPGSTEIHPEKQMEIRNSISGKNGKTIHIEAAAYASIEGDKSSNQRLAKDRMEQFMQLIRPYKDSMVTTPKIKIREQWELFYKQIKGTPLESLKTMPSDDIREYVNIHKKDSLLSALLNEQRYMVISMVWRNDHKVYLPAKTTLEEYDSLKTRIQETLKPSREHLAALEKKQLALYAELSKRDKESIIVPDVPNLERYPVFKYHKLMFRAMVLNDISDKEFYDTLHELVKSKYFPNQLKSQAIYNNLVLIYQNYLNGELENLMDIDALDCFKYRHSEFYFKKYNSLKCKKQPPFQASFNYYVLKEIPAMIKLGNGMISDFPEKQLMKYYYLYTIHSLSEYVPVHPEIPGLLSGIKNYYHPVDSILTDIERLKLAYLYCHFNRFSTAKLLLEPIANRAEPDKEALKLYAVLRSEDFEDEHEYIEMLIREFPRLGKEEWCDIWFNPDYSNFLLLEDLRLKNFYNCNCDR